MKPQTAPRSKADSAAARCAPALLSSQSARAAKRIFSASVLRRGGSSLPASRRKGRTPPFLQAPGCAPACEVRPAHAEASHAPVTSRIGTRLQRKRPAPRRLVVARVPQKRPHAALFASARLRACVRSAPRACRSVARAGYQPHRNAPSAQASCAAAARRCPRPAKKAARRPFCKRQAARLRAKCAPRMQKRRTRRLPAASEGAFRVNAARRPFCRRQAARLHAKCAPRIQNHRLRRLPAASEGSFSLNAALLSPQRMARPAHSCSVRLSMSSCTSRPSAV